MPNIEIRKKLEDRNPKTAGLVCVAEHCFETAAKTGSSGCLVRISDFGFLSALGFRPSDFCSAMQPSKIALPTINIEEPKNPFVNPGNPRNLRQKL